MKFVTIGFSVLTLMYLSYMFIIEDKPNQDAGKTLSQSNLITPAYISDTPLEVEKVWHQLKADRAQAKQPVGDVVDNALKNKDILTVGDNTYALYGIFNASKGSSEDTSAIKNSVKSNDLPSKAFILIKALSKKDKSQKVQMLKVMQGEELSKGITLIAVTSNSISFQKADELVEFKLFDAKK